MLRCTIVIASLTFSLGSGISALAQATNGSPPVQAPEAGAAGRGVRILPPEPPAPAPVANPPQAVAPTANAVAPRADPAIAPVASAPAPALPVLAPCNRPVAKPTLRFSEAGGFDRRLRSKLRRGRAVVVDLDTPYRVDNEAPAPLGAWLNEVKQSGGAVSVAPYCQKGRGMGGFFARLFGGGPAEPYKAARGYDAVLHVDAVDQVVTQVEFAPRRAGT
ncbi:hypothetical protein Q4610_15980 [Sphingobium sp. HBC34]|uniref:Rhodanese domain-containing protein n=1 Tax=Sphingobium cyanobacteriorum TaxID=3063954 RepID=A0ABT8ZSV5_9SPHN|nr:hypothetical protein [Sphingobium sp. HBC34]MDO7836546.1 hypothetical protein [Sphingobium sp. HBC34]